MIQLTESEKEEYLEIHLKHRLTLVRTLRFRDDLKYDYSEQGDIYRCVKDSTLIAVRLFMDFLGIKGTFRNGNYSIERIKRRTDEKFSDDIKLDNFSSNLIDINMIDKDDKKILAGVYVRADKELAHITYLFNEEYNKPEILMKASSIIECLLENHLYKPLGKRLPTID